MTERRTVTRQPDENRYVEVAGLQGVTFYAARTPDEGLLLGSTNWQPSGVGVEIALSPYEVDRVMSVLVPPVRKRWWRFGV